MTIVKWEKRMARCGILRVRAPENAHLLRIYRTGGASFCVDGRPMRWAMHRRFGDALVAAGFVDICRRKRRARYRRGREKVRPRHRGRR
jgi:hypothetical protein